MNGDGLFELIITNSRRFAESEFPMHGTLYIIHYIIIMIQYTSGNNAKDIIPIWSDDIKISSNLKYLAFQHSMKILYKSK